MSMNKGMSKRRWSPKIRMATDCMDTKEHIPQSSNCWVLIQIFLLHPWFFRKIKKKWLIVLTVSIEPFKKNKRMVRVQTCKFESSKLFQPTLIVADDYGMLWTLAEKQLHCLFPSKTSNHWIVRKFVKENFVSFDLDKHESTKQERIFYCTHPLSKVCRLRITVDYSTQTIQLNQIENIENQISEVVIQISVSPRHDFLYILTRSPYFISHF